MVNVVLPVGSYVCYVSAWMRSSYLRTKKIDRWIFWIASPVFQIYGSVMVRVCLSAW